jgi:hypothetical protein
MSYRNDQYFNLRQAGETYGLSPNDPRSGAEIGALNRDFVYPDRTLRTDTVLTGGRGVESKLQRGYIRSIANSLGGVSLKQAKCQFQFNPRVLNTSVNQNTKILDFLHQDASQYAQPIPGNVSFSFGLFFDRSYEMNRGGRDTQGYDVNSSNPWERYGPETVGVLHDLAALYSVIGQGIGAQQKQYIQSVLENQIKGEINAQNANAVVTTDEDGNVVDSGGAATDASSTQAEYTTSASEFIGMEGNFGNVAFLLPLPVRVVFSSLYIVEGLIQNASVKFTKFNHAMVPMQASVELLMEAKYIGFAKKNTFFTEVLAKREEATLQEAQRQEQALEAIETYAGAGAQIKAATVSIIPEEDDTYATAIKVEGMASERRAFATDRKAESIKGRCEVKFKGDEGYDGLKKLFEEGLPVESTVTASATIWRFTEKFREENSDIFSKSGSANDLSAEDKDQIIELLESYDVSDTTPISDYDGDKRPFKTVLRLKSAVVTPDDDKGTASSKEGFERQADGVIGEDTPGVYDRAIQVDSDMAANDTQFRFLVKYEVKITIKVSGGEVTGEGHYVYIHGATGGNFVPSHDVPLTWPQASNTAQGGN